MLSSAARCRPAARPGLCSKVVAAGGGAQFGRSSDDGGSKRRPGDRQRSSSYQGEAQSSQSERPRRLRPAGPSDTPLRADNRDLLMGLLTERAAKTLIFYFMELNPTLMQWLEYYLTENPIPREGSWDDVSGENFLRKLLSMPVEETRWDFYGRDKMYAKSSPLGVDPRSIAQRIMEIRSQIAREWIEELKQVSEENAILMRETVASSFTLADLPVVDPAQATSSTHPELLHPDFD